MSNNLHFKHKFFLETILVSTFPSLNFLTAFLQWLCLSFAVLPANKRFFNVFSIHCDLLGLVIFSYLLRVCRRQVDVQSIPFINYWKRRHCRLPKHSSLKLTSIFGFLLRNSFFITRCNVVIAILIWNFSNTISRILYNLIIWTSLFCCLFTSTPS